MMISFKGVFIISNDFFHPYGNGDPDNQNDFNFPEVSEKQESFFKSAAPNAANLHNINGPSPNAPDMAAPQTNPGFVDSTVAPVVPQLQNQSNIAPDFSGVEHLAPKKRKKTRKGPVYLLFLLFSVFFIGIIYFAVSNLFNNEKKQLGIITLSKEIDAHSGTAIIVRDEFVISEEDVSDIDFKAPEGIGISKSSPVCTVYTNGLNKKELNTLGTHREEIKKQQLNLIASLASPDTRLQQLNAKIERLAKETQSLVRGAVGNMILHEQDLKEAIVQRQSYIKSKFPDDTKLLRLYDNEANQLQKIETWAKHLIAPQNGIVSFYTDGLENEVNKESHLSLDPMRIKDILSGKHQISKNSRDKKEDIYRIVQPNQWFAIMHILDKEWTPIVGDEFQLTIESFKNTTVTATITSVTKIGGELFLRLSVNDSVDPVLYTRNCQVHISKSKDSFSVPSKALAEENGQFYIVLVFKEGEYLLPIDVLSRSADEVHFVPKDNISLAEGITVLLFN